MADFLYNQGSADLWNTLQPIDLIVDTVRVMLVTSSYVANRDNDNVDDGGGNDPIDHELSGTGYVAGHGNSGRKTLASKTITVDKTNDRVTFDAADVSWPGINAGTAAQAEIHKEGTSDDTDARLICHVDSGGFPETTNGTDLDITWNAGGIFYLSTV